MNFLICVFPKEQILYRTGLGNYFPNKECLLWNHVSNLWLFWLNGWVFVYELCGCGYESRCSHLNFRHRACFEQGVPRHSGNSRMWIYSETCTWHDKNIQLKNNSLWHRENQKTHLKTESNFTIYQTVQHNKCIVCMKLILSWFLSTLKGRKSMHSYLETQFHMSINENWLYIPTPVLSSCFKGSWNYSNRLPKHFLLLE